MAARGIGMARGIGFEVGERYGNQKKNPTKLIIWWILRRKRVEMFSFPSYFKTRSLETD